MTKIVKSRAVPAIFASLLLAAACGGDSEPAPTASAGPETAANPASPADPASPSPADAGQPAAPAVPPVYVTASVLLGDDAQTTYVALLSNLGTQTIALDKARELAGWSSAIAHQGNLFTTNGEAPIMTRNTVGPDLSYTPSGSLSFANYGAMYADSLFVAPDRAYLFEDEAIVWNPTTMEISGTFPLPKVEDRANGMEWGGAGTGRNAVVRGNRTYITTSWANWDEYSVSEDALILVIDNEKNQVIAQVPAPCPYLDVATLADDGHVYFSNWVYSVGQTFLKNKKKACAVRIPPNSDAIDPSWSLTFADLTEGREAAALNAIGNGKALISVFHHERVDLQKKDQTPSELTNGANWRLWLLDLAARTAKPLEGVDFNAGGATVKQVDGRGFVMLPNSDYASTSVYEVTPEGKADLRWTIPGWSMQLDRLR